MRSLFKLLRRTRRRISNFFRSFRRFFSYRITTVKRVVKHYPFVSVLVTLLLVFVLIVLGDRLRKPKEDEKGNGQVVKTVNVYRIGSVPKVTVSGKLEKSHVVTIIAQSAGVVQKINVKPGQDVSAGTALISLSSNYQGAVMPAVQRQLASKSYEFQKENLLLQKDLIGRNRDVANKSDENSDKLREISRESRNITQDTINVSRDSLKTVESLIEFYKQSTTPTLTDAATDENILLGLNQQRLGLLSGVSAAEQGLRQLNYNESEDNPPAQLSNLQKDFTQKQLDLQEKTLDLNLDIAFLNLRLAQIGESLMFPAAPYRGKIERIFVRPGQTVQPGTPLVVLAGDINTISVVVLVGKQIVQSISPLTESVITVGVQTFRVFPSHIATEPTDGRLFAVTYTLPQIGNGATSKLEKGSQVESTASSRKNEVDGQYVSVEMPVGYSDTNSAFPFIPIDSVFQSQDKSLVFVEENGEAKSREVSLGQVYGRYVEIKEGLGKNDAVLLDRTLIEGDRVEIKN